MIAALLCVLALASSVWMGRRSTAAGLVTVVGWGYFFGILRANNPTAASHFIFDSAVAGLYLTQAKKLFSAPAPRIRTLTYWTAALILWPCFVFFLPFQHPLVALVGLRGNIFFLPMILLGARLRGKELLHLAAGLAALNLAALGVAMAEYALGVPRFFPINEVTQIIYASNDVAGYQYFRIPSVFSNAHSYGGTMVVSLPLLFGSWVIPGQSRWRKLWYLAGMVAALIGILMSATRVHFLVAAILMLTIVFTARFRMQSRIGLALILAVLGVVAVGNARLSRFQSLGDSSYVSERVAGSVNRGFFEILSEYPMGNGLGGGGTSIPYFLQDLVRRPVAMESEFARILLELGLPGLVLWVAFMGWFFTRPSPFLRGPWQSGRRLAWVCCGCYFGIGLIGVGLLTAIPQSAILLLMMGWIGVSPAVEDGGARARLALTPEFALAGAGERGYARR